MPDRSETDPVRRGDSNDESANRAELRITQITCPEQLHPIAENLAPELNHGASPEVVEALYDFMKAVFHRKRASGMVFGYWKESYVDPILDVYVHWSSLIQLPLDSPEMRGLLDKHVTCLHRFNESFDSLLSIEDTRTCRSVEALVEQLQMRSTASGLFRVLACVKFER